MTDNASTLTYQLLDRNLGLDLMRVTEAAALAAGRWAGKGDKEGGDKAAGRPDAAPLGLRPLPRCCRHRRR